MLNPIGSDGGPAAGPSSANRSVNTTGRPRTGNIGPNPVRQPVEGPPVLGYNPRT